MSELKVKKKQDFRHMLGW